jgi:hypothetical protein
LLKTTLKDLQFPEIPKSLFCDNRSAIDLADNHRISDLSQYIVIHYHGVQELVYDKTLQWMYIWTTDNLADIYTKRLRESLLYKLHVIALTYNQGGCCKENRFQEDRIDIRIGGLGLDIISYVLSQYSNYFPIQCTF